MKSALESDSVGDQESGDRSQSGAEVLPGRIPCHRGRSRLVGRSLANSGVERGAEADGDDEHYRHHNDQHLHRVVGTNDSKRRHDSHQAVGDGTPPPQAV